MDLNWRQNGLDNLVSSSRYQSLSYMKLTIAGKRL
jgi:hypothetical protein